MPFHKFTLSYFLYMFASKDSLIHRALIGLVFSYA